MFRGIRRYKATALLWAAGVVCAWPAFVQATDGDAEYIARLLINETPFPGEQGYISEKDSQATMLAILWVLHARILHIPPGYAQEEIAAIRTRNIIDVITAGGVKGQCDGFYKDTQGRPVTVARVDQRLQRLREIAARGTPGRFTRLIAHAEGLADAYRRGGIEAADRFAGLSRIGVVPVTGRAYAWMTNRDYYTPGGSFVRIPNGQGGVLGGNRFFTLRKR